MKVSSHSKKEQAIKYTLHGTSLLVFFLAFVILYTVIDNELAIPSPKSVFTDFFGLLGNGATYNIVFNTFLRLIISLIISFLIGISTGLLAGLCKYVRYLFDPLMSIFRTIPLASVIVIVLMVFTRVKSPYVITSLMLAPLIYEGVKNGVLAIDRDLMDVWRLESGFNEKVIFKAIIPLISTYLVTSLFQAIGLGFKVMIMAEYLAFIDNSIGKELVSAKNNLEPSLLFAWTLILIFLVLIIEAIPQLIIAWQKHKKGL